MLDKTGSRCYIITRKGDTNVVRNLDSQMGPDSAAVFEIKRSFIEKGVERKQNGTNQAEASRGR